MRPPAAATSIPPVPISIVACTAPVSGLTRSRSVPRPVTQSEPPGQRHPLGCVARQLAEVCDGVGRQVDAVERRVAVVRDPGARAVGDERGGAAPGVDLGAGLPRRRIDAQQLRARVVRHPERSGREPEVGALAADAETGPPSGRRVDPCEPVLRADGPDGAAAGRDGLRRRRAGADDRRRLAGRSVVAAQLAAPAAGDPHVRAVERHGVLRQEVASLRRRSRTRRRWGGST